MFLGGYMASTISSSFFDARRGYALCEVTPTSWRATYRAVTDEFDENSPVETASTWLINAGDPGVSLA